MKTINQYITEFIVKNHITNYDCTFEEILGWYCTGKKDTKLFSHRLSRMLIKSCITILAGRNEDVFGGWHLKKVLNFCKENKNVLITLKHSVDNKNNNIYKFNVKNYEITLNSGDIKY